MHRYTNIDSIECSYENVKVAFGAGEVVIFYFPFATMYLKKKNPGTGQWYDFEQRNKF